MTRPNLFSFATSELSQDAVLCWVAAWADPQAVASDPQLGALGRDFVGALFKLHGREIPAVISSVNVERQYRNIDVLITVNEQYAICIEDKVGTTDHSNQLERYKEALSTDVNARHWYPCERILAVYVQTHEQGSYGNVDAAEYQVFDRRALLDILRPHTSNNNAIVCDFYGHLLGINERVESFRSVAPADWSWFAWQGFFGELQRRLGGGKWGYVANPSGGFLGFWWGDRKDATSEQYLQLQAARLCVRVSVNEGVNRGEVRDAWIDRIGKAAGDLVWPSVRPLSRRGHGRTMTVAVLDDDYRVRDALGILDLDATIARLRTAEAVLDRAASRRT